jgi:outer membrane protein assembly factor BamB
VWTLKLQGRLPFLPQVADGVIMIGSGHGRVAAINAATGELLWQRDARKAFIASPVVIDGKVTLFSSGGAITQWPDRAVMATQ